MVTTLQTKSLLPQSASVLQPSTHWRVLVLHICGELHCELSVQPTTHVLVARLQ
jgi:hypothetical protein